MGIVSKFYLFEDNNTPVANISAYIKLIVSYCRSRAKEKSLRHVAIVDEFLDLRKNVVLHLFSLS